MPGTDTTGVVRPVKRRRRQGAQRALCTAAGVCLLAWQPAAAQVSGFLEKAERSAQESSTRDLPVEVQADRLEYDRATGLFRGWGSVVIRKGEKVLTADNVRGNLNTEDFHAFGNVTFTDGESTWRGESFDYNFRQQKAAVASLSGEHGPLRVLHADKTERPAPNVYYLEGAEITTCTNPVHRLHYHVRARDVTINEGEDLTAHGAVVYIGGIPIFYLPYWYRNLREEIGFRIYPGYSSRMGFFALTSLRYRINPLLRGVTHVDYRSKRGVGLGQDIKWNREGFGDGMLRFYYIEDRDPLDDRDDPVASQIEAERYRVRLEHEVSLSDRDHLLIQANYLSDTDILEDFFEDEYRLSHQPENYISYSHRGDRYTVGVEVQARLNDFYSNVNRVPEVSLNIMRQQIGDSFFYYESESAASYLERVYAVGLTNVSDYSAFRLDSAHKVYRPARAMGFLNLVPRVGYRGTYYSATRELRTVIEVSEHTTTNTVGTNTFVETHSETNTVTFEVDADGDVRSVFEMGLELSFKAFKTWDHLETPLRHIVEPYADYTYIPEPNLLPENLYAFDSVDEIDALNQVKLGVRNKLQRKIGTRSANIIDADLYTFYRIERPEGQSAVNRYYANVKLRPARWVRIDFDAQYNAEDSTIDVFNTDMTFQEQDLWKTRLQYRFIENSSSLVSIDAELFPKAKWTVGAFGRHQFEGDRTEEVGAFLQRNLDCMSLRCGVVAFPGYTRPDGTEREDEWRIIFAWWLSAFPRGVVAGRYSH